MATAWKEGELLHTLYCEKTWREDDPFSTKVTVADCIEVEKEVQDTIDQFYVDLDCWWQKENAPTVVGACLIRLRMLDK